MPDIISDISYQDLHPTIWYCSRVRDSRLVHYHSHKNIEIAFVLAGNGQYFVDGQTFDVKQGDMLIFNPGVMHQSIVSDPSDPTIEFVCGFSDIHLHDMPENRIVLPGTSPILSLTSENKREISRCCYEIIEENSSSEPGRYYMIQAQLMRMLVLIFRSIKGHKENEVEGVNFESYSKGYVVKNILAYLNENYSQHISLDQIAKNMYLSPVYISKIFKEKTGDSPINYLIHVRLEKAKEMLEDGRESIRTIANLVGYDDVYHFSKLFKKHFGVSPMYYRKKSLSDEEL